MTSPDDYIDHPRRASRELDNWQATIGREWVHCGDAEYAQHLGRMYFSLVRGPLVRGPFKPVRGPFSRFKRLIYRRQVRPLAGEVEAALHRAGQSDWSGGQAWTARLARLQRAKAKDRPIEDLIADLNHPYWVNRLVSRHVLLYRGGEAVEALVALAEQSTTALQQTAAWLVESIVADTASRLASAPDQWLCAKCLTRCQAHRTWIAGLARLTYYGCRSCRRSWGLLYCPQGVTAVLDSAWRAEYSLADGVLRVNWLARKALFDFDRVVVQAASDQAVEQFAMRAGNDGDPVRRERYRRLDYAISPACALSPNTLRILEHVFGQAETSRSQ